METGLTWKAKPWSQLDRDELHALLRLRIDVFVLEQDCPYSELDGKDLRSIHVWATDADEAKGGAAACCTRVVAPGVSYKEPSIGRVATRSDLRGTGLGKDLDAPQLGRLRARMARAGRPDFSAMLPRAVLPRPRVCAVRGDVPRRRHPACGDAEARSTLIPQPWAEVAATSCDAERTMAASTKDTNRGCGLSTVLAYSGWN